MDYRLREFLLIVKSNGRPAISAWGQQIRAALSENYIRIGFGGRLELTDDGRMALSNGDRDHGAT